MMRSRSMFAAIAIAIPSAAAADAKTDAVALHDQGIQDLEAGRTEQACKELAASLAKDPDTGTKGALAVCYQKLGKIASAWRLWKAIGDTGDTPAARSEASANAAALDPRLPKYLAVAHAPSPSGLVVTINGDAVDLSLGLPLPTDPGALVATAKAPGYQEWRQTFEATEGKTTTIEVPPLVAEVAAPAEPARPDHLPPAAESSKTLAYVVGGAGAAAVVVGLGFGLRARGKYNDAHANDHCDAANHCDQIGFDLETAAFSSARTATVLVGIGVVGVGIGTYLWLRARGEREPRSAILAPVIGDHTFGAVLSGRL